jgi:AGZA family xanthine/uracil permease-like MFS transporter
LFLAPLFGSIPSAATAPALIIVGVMMMSPVKDIEWDDMTEAIPAFLTMIFMIVAYSIADGIMFGILSFVLLKLFTKKTKDISKMTWVVFALFVIKIIFGAL